MRFKQWCAYFLSIFSNNVKEEIMPKRYVELVKKNKDWFWRLRAANGQLLAHSETYSSKTKARKTAMNVFKDLAASKRYDWVFKEI